MWAVAACLGAKLRNIREKVRLHDYMRSHKKMDAYRPVADVPTGRYGGFFCDSIKMLYCISIIASKVSR